MSHASRLAAYQGAVPRGRTKLDDRSIALRREILGVLEHSRRGHVGSAFSIVELVRVLYDDILRVDPACPEDPDRDRFVLSKGHGCLALYVLLAEKGFFPREELTRFCKREGILGGHPERHKIPGVEFSTGSLGHGPSVGVGISLSARHDGRSFRTFVLVGDGECDEGSVWEAALSASKHRLSNLVVLVDYNRSQSYGPKVDVLDLEPFADKWRSFGFAVREVDGHDAVALRQVLGSVPFEPGKPGVVICHTVKGKGIRLVETDPTWHHKSRISDEQLALLVEGLESYS